MLSGNGSTPAAEQQKQTITQLGLYAFSYLCLNEQLQLRIICKSYRDAIQEKQKGPYQTKAQFVMAMTGNFLANANFKLVLSTAWMYYSMINSNPDQEPALLHKLRDHDIYNKYPLEVQFDMRDNGRIYDPRFVHCWAYNAVWMLANIHKGREFSIISAVSDCNMKRHGFDKASAFAKEIATALEAGYTADFDENDSLVLTPPDAETRSRANLRVTKLSHARAFTLYGNVKICYENQLAKQKAEEAAAVINLRSLNI